MDVVDSGSMQVHDKSHYLVFSYYARGLEFRLKFSSSKVDLSLL